MKIVHKYTRKYNPFRQFLFCSGKKCIGSESVSWFWKNVTCKRCNCGNPHKRKGKAK